jgi:signal transduction histidine kinase
MKWWLAAVLVSLLSSAQISVAQPSGELLTNALEVLSLSTERALSAIPVSVKGVVTAAQPDWSGRFFVQDDSAGVFVENIGVTQPAPGDVVHVTGFSDPGAFAPIITQPAWKKLGTAPLPAAKPVTIENLMAGVEDSQRVEVAGIVRAVETDGVSVIYDIVSGGYRFRAFTHLTSAGDPQLLVGTRIRVRGTAATSFHAAQRHLVAVTIYVPRAMDLIMEKAFSEDPFEEPIIPLDSVAEYHPDYASGKRIHVRGTVAYQRPFQDLFLQDDTGGLQILTRQGQSVAPGDIVEAVGFPAYDQYLPVLQDAIFRKVDASTNSLTAKLVSLEELQAGLHHADLVTLRGKLLDRSIHYISPGATVARPSQVILTIQTSNFLFTAEGPVTDSNARLNALPLGSLLELTGICMLHVRMGGTMESGDVGTMESLRLLLPSVDSVRVLAQPSWLTPRRLLVGLAASSVVLILTLIWSVTVSQKNAALKVVVREKVRAQEELQKAHDELDDRVKERTAQLKFEMDARKEAEVRFKATLAERTRLAQELHDTLEQSLTGIGLQLDAAAERFVQREGGTNPPLQMARNLMSRSQLELRRSIWDLRSRELEEFDLPNALRVSAEEILKGTHIGLEFDIKGQPQPLSEITEENLLRIGREALTNLIKHAKADRATLTLDYRNHGVMLTIADDGRGFEPGNCPGSNEGHFGLSGMAERAKRIGGRLTLSSAPGEGTRITLEVPPPPTPSEHAADTARGLI